MFSKAYLLVVVLNSYIACSLALNLDASSQSAAQNILDSKHTFFHVFEHFKQQEQQWQLKHLFPLA